MKIVRYKNIPTSKRLKNGEHRRSMIWTSLVRRRLIDPTIMLEHLCYAALYELTYFIDNTDKKDIITRADLLVKAEEALRTDLDKYREGMRSKKKFKVNKEEAARQGISIQKAVGIANGLRNRKAKETEYEALAPKYDLSKNVSQNAEAMGLKWNKADSLKKWILERQGKI